MGGKASDGRASGLVLSQTASASRRNCEGRGKRWAGSIIGVGSPGQKDTPARTQGWSSRVVWELRLVGKGEGRSAWTVHPGEKGCVWVGEEEEEDGRISPSGLAKSINGGQQRRPSGGKDGRGHADNSD
jgi:hypothetical protein